MAAKMFTVSLTLSVEAKTEDEALAVFETLIERKQYESGSFDVEEEDTSIYEQI